MNSSLRNGLRLLLKVDFHVLFIVVLIAFCWIALHTVSFKLSANTNPSLSFYDLIKFINNDSGLRSLINLESASPGIHGFAMSVALLLPLVHCWLPHRYAFMACAAPLVYMGLAAVALYGAMLHRLMGFSDAGAFIGGQQGRTVAGNMVNDMLYRIWAAMSFETGFYISLAAAAYLALVGLVKLFSLASKERLIHRRARRRR